MLSRLLKITSLPKIIKAGRLFYKSSYLLDTGWWASFENKMPLDSNHKPLPWVTYSYIYFIIERLTKNMSIFEFGSGNSTLFYASRVKEIISLEHDQDWARLIKKDLPKNARVDFQRLEYGGDYSKYLKTLESKFDIIIVDGRDRVNCVMNSISHLGQEGVLVLDDSERTDYDRAREFLSQNEFREIKFWGMAPGLTYNKCTSVFYKNNNCLGI